MANSHGKFLSFILAITINIVMAFTCGYAQGQAGSPPGQSGSTKIAQATVDGSYKVSLVLPRQTVKNIMTLCSSGETLKGNLRNEELTVMGEIITGTLKGNTFTFTVKVGPGTLDFAGSADGKNVKGKVTIDGTTSDFEGPNASFDKNLCEP